MRLPLSECLPRVGESSRQDKRIMHIPDGFLDAKTAVAPASFRRWGVGIARSAASAHFPAKSRAPDRPCRRVHLRGPDAEFSGGRRHIGPFDRGRPGGSTFASCRDSCHAASVLILLVRRFAGRKIPRSRLLATAFAAWCSTVVASIACAGQLAWSGTVDWGIAFPAMANVHMLIGIGEALITTFVVAALAKLARNFYQKRYNPIFSPS